MGDRPQWPLNSEVLTLMAQYMENELGYNYLNTSFTSSSATKVPQVQEEDSEQDECCGTGCGCHD